MKDMPLIVAMILMFFTTSSFSSDFFIPTPYESDNKLVIYPAKTGFVVGAIAGGAVGVPLSMFAAMNTLYPLDDVVRAVNVTFVMSVVIGGYLSSAIVGAPFWLIDQACCVQDDLGLEDTG